MARLALSKESTMRRHRCLLRPIMVILGFRIKISVTRL